MQPSRTARRRERLDPLSWRRTRLKLLLASYYDAAEAADEGEQGEARGGEMESRPPMRNMDLWPRGSYKRVERCMDELRAKYPQAYRAVQAVYVLRWPIAEDDEVTRVWSRFGLYLMLEAMPEAIYVPAPISENAGYLASDANRYERRRRG